mgnify:CR=1 FL=1
MSRVSAGPREGVCRLWRAQTAGGSSGGRPCPRFAAWPALTPAVSRSGSVDGSNNSNALVQQPLLEALHAVPARTSPLRRHLPTRRLPPARVGAPSPQALAKLFDPLVAWMAPRYQVRAQSVGSCQHV